MKYRNIIFLDKAARRWDDGLPIGNGRIGAMVMGKVNDETIIINEETLWYGPKRNRSNPDAISNINKIRQLLLKGNVSKAAFLAKMSMTSTPKYNNPYQPAGDLRLCFLGNQTTCTKYKRELDIDHGIATVQYMMENVTYKRELFVSEKYNVLAIKLSSDGDKGLTLSANMSRKPFEENTGKIDNSTVGNWGVNGSGGVSYFTGVRMAAKGGTVNTMGDFVYCEDAKEVYIYLSAKTNFDGNAKYKEECLKNLDKAEEAGFSLIKKEHISGYRKLFNRVSLSINDASNDVSGNISSKQFTPDLPTNQLLDGLKKGDQTYLDYLTLLLFNFARYLMISSSYNCILPANLQGIWNGSYEPPWQCEFTININEEMNYWFVEKCNLPECHMPLFDLLDRLVENGKITAKEVYGCGGFCAHHNTNLWASTDIEGIFDASPFWVMGGAWLSLHMYEHYLFTQDEKFLEERALPVMREAIRFFEDYLYEDEDGYLLTGPSLSPENTYRSSAGEKGALSMSPTMDNMILRQLFTWYLEGSKVVGIGNDKDHKKIQNMIAKLPPTQISKDGRIMEWYQDYEECEPGHRHISHMYGLHPGNEIVEQKSELFEAARRTIEYRLSHGGGHTGWSKAWIACFFARLKDGEMFFSNLIELLQNSIQDNLLDVHPPFQIDGNFGIAEAILETLIQSHGGYIDILPALPPQWKKGELRGVRLRGGMTADIVWENSKLKELMITPDKDQEVELHYNDKIQALKLKSGIASYIETR